MVMGSSFGAREIKGDRKGGEIAGKSKEEGERRKERVLSRSQAV